VDFYRALPLLWSHRHTSRETKQDCFKKLFKTVKTTRRMPDIIRSSLFQS